MDNPGEDRRRCREAAQGADDWSRLPAFAGPPVFDAVVTYDGTGNRLVKVEADGSRTTSVYDPADQLISEETTAGITTYTYDLDGNRIRKDDPVAGITDYEWDFRNRLVRVETPAGEVFYEYDAADQRVRKDASDVGGDITRFVHDGQNVLIETDDAGDTTRGYTGTGEQYGKLVSQYDGSDSNYPLWDATGSAAVMTDPSGGDVATWNYRAFGTPVETSGDTDVTPYQFVGQSGYQAEPETNLIKAGIRYYEAPTNRWLSPDNPAWTDDYNPYRYVRNNPVDNIDPSGRELVGPRWDAKVTAHWLVNKNIGFDNGIWIIKLPSGDHSLVPLRADWDRVSSAKERAAAAAEKGDENAGFLAHILSALLDYHTVVRLDEGGMVARKADISGPDRAFLNGVYKELYDYEPFHTFGAALGARAGGLLKVLGGSAKAVVAFGLAAAPEPTMVTKAAAIGLAPIAADEIATGAKEIWTGDPQQSYLSQGLSLVMPRDKADKVDAIAKLAAGVVTGRVAPTTGPGGGVSIPVPKLSGGEMSFGWLKMAGVGQASTPWVSLTLPTLSSSTVAIPSVAVNSALVAGSTAAMMTGGGGGGGVPPEVEAADEAQALLVKNQQADLKKAMKDAPPGKAGTEKGKALDEMGARVQDFGTDSLKQLEKIPGIKVVPNVKIAEGVGGQIDNVVRRGSKSAYVTAYVESKLTIAKVNERITNQLTNAVKAAKPGDSVFLHVARAPTDKEIAALKDALGGDVFGRIRIVSKPSELYLEVKTALGL